MGCNNSKLTNPNGGDVLPARMRPLLRQRIEEFRKRRNFRGEDGTLSKKELLKDDEGNSDQSLDENEVLEETQLPKEQQIITRVVAIEKLSQVVPLPIYEFKNKEEKLEGHNDQKQEEYKDVENKVVEVKSALSLQENKHELTNTKHDDDDDKEEEEEDEDEDDDEIGRFIGPGSPSFRIYCIEANEKKEEELYDTHKVGELKADPTIIVHHKSSSIDTDDSGASASDNTHNSNEVVKLERTQKKKGYHKIKKLEAMKKNLVNVKNLQKNRMNRMMACAGNDRRSLLSDN